jgi:hypothetical protein
VKLQKKLAECNNKKTNTPPKAEITGSNIPASSTITAMLYNAIGHKVATDIAADNVLIFGSSREWNQQVSLLVQAAFAHAGRRSKIISATKFLSIPIDKRRNSSMFYIVICRDVNIATEKLSELKAYTGTQILFKIVGLNLGVHNFGVSISKSAAAILRSLNIKEGKSISIGLLASLGIKEFCVVNSRNICKRVL